TLVITRAAASANRLTTIIDTPAALPSHRENRTSDLEEDLLAIECVEDAKPEEHKRQRERQRSVDRVEPRCEQHLVQPSLELNRLAVIVNREDRVDAAGHHGGPDESHHRVHAVDDERLRPSLPALYVDDPHDRGERNAGHSAGEHYV